MRDLPSKDEIAASTYMGEATTGGTGWIALQGENR